MTPHANTLYAVCLFLALCCLLKWTARRQRGTAELRRCLMDALSGEETRLRLNPEV